MKFEIKGIWIHKVVIVWECQKIAFFDENINFYRRGSPGPLQTGLWGSSIGALAHKTSKITQKMNQNDSISTQIRNF